MRQKQPLPARLLRRKDKRMTVDTKTPNPSPEIRHFPRREPDPDQIRGWPVIENGEERELLIHKNSVAWVLAGKDNLKGKTLIGLRTAGAKAIPVSADFEAVKNWWTGRRLKTNESVRTRGTLRLKEGNAQ
jgi:hypothetical protein